MASQFPLLHWYLMGSPDTYPVSQGKRIMLPSWYSAFLLSSDKKAWGTFGRFEQVTKSNKHMGEKHSKHRGVQSLTLIIFLFTFYCLQQTLHKNQNMVVFNVSLSVIPFQEQKVYHTYHFAWKKLAHSPTREKAKGLQAVACWQAAVGKQMWVWVPLTNSSFCVILRYVPRVSTGENWGP